MQARVHYLQSSVPPAIGIGERTAHFENSHHHHPSLVSLRSGSCSSLHLLSVCASVLLLFCPTGVSLSKSPTLNSQTRRGEPLCADDNRDGSGAFDPRGPRTAAIMATTTCCVQSPHEPKSASVQNGSYEHSTAASPVRIKGLDVNTLHAVRTSMTLLTGHTSILSMSCFHACALPLHSDDMLCMRTFCPCP